MTTLSTPITIAPSTAKHMPRPYHAGYDYGSQAAVEYVQMLRAKVASGDLVSPADLAYVLAALFKRIDGLGGWTMAERPVAEITPEQQAILGEYFGFCAGLLAMLSHQP